MSTLTLLQEFCDEWNADRLLLATNGICVTEQPVYQGQQNPYGMRPSSIGQPAIISVYSAFINRLLPSFNPQKEQQVPYGRRTDLFNVGHSTEARLLKVLTDYGFNVDAHVPSSISPLLSGTCDCVLNDSLLVDVKTAAAANYKRYSSGLPDKYIAQLAVYQEGLKSTYPELHQQACVLMYNKDNSELQIITPTATELTQALNRAYEIVNITKDLFTLYVKYNDLVRCVSYLDGNVQSVPLRAEVYNGEKTGNLLVPTDLQYNAWLIPILYETYTRPNQRKKLTTYITRELEVEETAYKLLELL